jgi:hypothetical protein
VRYVNCKSSGVSSWVFCTGLPRLWSTECLHFKGLAVQQEADDDDRISFRKFSNSLPSFRESQPNIVVTASNPPFSPPVPVTSNAV